MVVKSIVRNWYNLFGDLFGYIYQKCKNTTFDPISPLVGVYLITGRLANYMYIRIIY